MTDDTKPELKPEHNPDNLTPEQYGAPEWRLLREGEIPDIGDEQDVGASGTNWTSVDGFYATRVEDLVLTYRRRVARTKPPCDCERLREENAVLKSQVDNADVNLEQVRMVLRADLAKRDAELVSLRAELAGARKAMEEAPHQYGCVKSYDASGNCNCWKAAALTPRC